MKTKFLSFKIFIGWLIFSLSIWTLPQRVFAQMAGKDSSVVDASQGAHDPSLSEDLKDATQPLLEEGTSEEDLLKAQQKVSSLSAHQTQEGLVVTQPQQEASQILGEGSQAQADLAKGSLSEDQQANPPGQALESQPVENLGQGQDSQAMKGDEIVTGENPIQDQAPQDETQLTQDAQATQTGEQTPEAQSQETQGSDVAQQNAPEMDPNKELITMTKEELDQLQEDIAKIDDKALKAEVLGAVKDEIQLVVVDSGTQKNDENAQPKIDLTSEEGQKQAIQQLDANANTLLQNGASQQSLTALKEAINSGDKAKAEALMSEMAQHFSPNANGANGPIGGEHSDQMASMPVFEMMKDFGFNPGPTEMGQMGEHFNGPGPGGMEIVDFKDFYTGVRVEEMGVAMMEKGGFSPEQIDQFTDKAKQEFLNHHDGNFDPKMAFEGAFKEVFGQGPMMEGQGLMGAHGPEMAMAGPNGGPMDPSMMQGGPNGGPMGGPTDFNFTEFLANKQDMMGQLAFIANHEDVFTGGPNGHQGFEGPGQFNGGPGPSAGGSEFFGPSGPGGPGGFEGPNFGGFEPTGFQGEFHGPEGFEPQEAKEFNPPPELPPLAPGQVQNPTPENLDPPGFQHHDLGNISHVDGDGHACTPPNCS